MRISKTSDIMEYALAFLFVLPYAETGIIADTFRYTTNDTNWRAILSIELILFVLCLPLSFVKVRRDKTKIQEIKGIIIPFILVMFFILLYSFLINGVTFSSFNLFLMITTPLLNAYFINKFIAYKAIRLDYIIRKSVFLFVLFVIFAIVFNIIKYGFSISLTDSSTRLTASAGGPVIFGYTISVVFAFVISHKEIFRQIEILASLFILFIGILLTQDRGAIVVLALCVLFLFKNYTKKGVLWVALLIIPLFLFFMMDNIKESTFFSRFEGFDASSDDRLFTLLSAVSVYFEEIQYIIFGHGFDGFFPYQDWLLNTSHEEVYNNIDFNIIQYKGRFMLVQPHNTFVYFLMESGLVGLFSFCWMFHGFYKKTSANNRYSLLLVLAAVICISLLESTLILEPGISCTLWLIVFYSFLYCRIPKK